MGNAKARAIRYSSVLLLVVLLVTSCSDFMAEQGQILLTIELDNRGQDVVSYVITGIHANGQEFTIDNGTASQAEVRSLAPGEWTITVVARDGDAGQIGEGTQVVQLSAGKKVDAIVLVVFGQAPPSGLEGAEPARFGSAEGEITGTTILMEYRLKSAVADAYVACSNTETAVDPGIYLVRFSARTGFDESPDLEVAVPVFQPIQLTITSPTLTTTKAYDGTAVAAITAGALVNLRPLETVSVSAVATYDTALAGTDKTITVVYSLAGDDKANYMKPVDYQVAIGAITAIQLTITAPSLTTSKEYDESTSAEVTAGSLSGIISGDDVTVSAEATYDTATVGTGKTITVVYSLGGIKAANYVKPVDYQVATGAITALPLTAIGAISGTARVGKDLTVGTLTPTGATADYQWTICSTVDGIYGNIDEATMSTYTPVAADEGKFLKVVATGTGNYSGTVISAATAAVAEKIYVVGDTGPSGGLIFYDKGSYSDGWQYLEAAPYGWYNGGADPRVQWGAQGLNYTVIPSATNTAVGTGEVNTVNIVSYHDSLGTLYPLKGDYYTNPTIYHSNNNGIVAAKECAVYSVEYGGTTYDDWFLPSKDELNIMCVNLKVLGGLSGIYWSSSEFNSSAAWYKDLGSGSQDEYVKSYSNRVRPVRAF